MKKLLAVLILILISNSYSISQSGWTRVTDSIPHLYIMSMQFTSANNGFACGSYYTTNPGAFLRTTNGGNNWIVTQFSEYSADDLSFVNDNTGYISAWQGPGKSYVLKTTNGGINWSKLDSNNASFFKIKFFDSNNGMIVSKYSVSHRTTDGGNTWLTRYGTSLWSEPNSLICLNAETWLVADKGIGIYKTTNGGVNWEHILSNDMKGVNMFFLNSAKGFLVDYNARVYKTTNSGNNWFKIDSIANIINFYEASITFIDSLTGYLVSASYFYKTTNGGYNWNRFLISTNFSGLASYFINANTGFAGGSSGFIYKTENGGVGITNLSGEIPTKYFLNQNYPNPFNPSTKIRFDIIKTGIVKLEIYDIVGRKLQTLINENLQPGTYETTFDAAGLSSGIYFYKLTTDGFSQTKKMLFLK